MTIAALFQPVFPAARSARLRHALAVLMAAAALMVAASPAFALDLDAAKAQGLLGETAQGYVAAPAPSPNPEVAQLAASVNLERKARYTDIAAQQGTTLTVVEQLAGAKLIEQAPAGQYVRDASGTWRRK